MIKKILFGILFVNIFSKLLASEKGKYISILEEIDIILRTINEQYVLL